jgi:hypothetical protein
LAPPRQQQAEQSVLAWKIMAFIGMALALLSFVSLTTEALGTGGYSATALTMGYLGVVLLAIGSSNLYQKRYVFFLTIFLSTTALYILALYRYEVVGSTPLSNISVLPGTIFLLMFVGIATYVILKLNSSLTNKRKLYQTFSLIMFNLGALGIVAKHLIAPGLHHGGGSILPLWFVHGDIRRCRKGFLRMGMPLWIPP